MKTKIFLFLGLIPALILQTIGAYGYFVYCAGSESAAIVYGSIKVVLLLFPVIWLLFALRWDWREQKEVHHRESLLWGILSGVIIGGGILGGGILFRDYFFQFAPQFMVKVRDLHLENHYIPILLASSVFHSLLEEYFWRWFLFRGWSRFIGVLPAALLSSAAFGAHHYIVLGTYFPLWLTLLTGTAVIGGGLIWCWIYTRTRSLLGAWISHMFVDIGIFAAGYVFLFL